MDKLWAPWRIEYIKMPKTDKCILCELPKKPNEKDRENLILYRGEKAYIILNRYPYNNGHLMIAPYRHIPSIINLSDEEALEIHQLTRLSLEILTDTMGPDGFNIGANIGKAAGAGIDEHYHLHIVPRWIGDTNYMPIISNTKILVEYLRDTYDKLKENLVKLIQNQPRKPGKLRML